MPTKTSLRKQDCANSALSTSSDLHEYSNHAFRHSFIPLYDIETPFTALIERPPHSLRLCLFHRSLFLGNRYIMLSFLICHSTALEHCYGNTQPNRAINWRPYIIAIYDISIALPGGQQPIRIP